MAEEYYDFLARMPPEAKRSFLRPTAIHEAGHAMAHWYLEKTNYLGTPLPRLRHVAVSLDGNPIPGLWGRPLYDLKGACVHPACFSPNVPNLPENHRLSAQEQRQVSADIVIYLAGPIAEDTALGNPAATVQEWRERERNRTSEAFSDCMTDGRAVEDAITLLGDRRQVYVHQAFSLANHIVRDHQLHISALTDALLDRGRIDGHEAYTIFDQVEAGGPK